MYNVILRFGYYEEIAIEGVNLRELMTIIPIVSNMKFNDNGTQKPITIVVEPVPAEEVEDGKDSE